MKLLFGLIGAFVGAVLGNVSAALAMAVVGAGAGWWWSARARATDLDAAALLRRIVALDVESQDVLSRERDT